MISRMLLILAVLLPKAGLGSEEPIEQLRVMTYNIHHCQGRDRKTSVARIANVIKQSNPDLVALQEVDVGTRRSGRVNQAEEIARLTGMQPVFGAAIRYLGGEYGNVVLAKSAIIGKKSVALPKPGGEQRAAVGLAIRLERRLVVTLISTHFDHESLDSRVQASRTIAKIVADSPNPVIVAGDLNCLREAPELAPLLSVVRL